MSLSDIQKVRLEVGDTEVGFPFLDDESYQYFLDKNNNSIPRASVDAAKAILFQLSTRSAESVDIFAFKNNSAEAYRQALLLFIRDPNLNPLYSNLKGWFGGVSSSEMQENDANPDNNAVRSPTQDRLPYQVIQGSTFWSIVNP